MHADGKADTAVLEFSDGLIVGGIEFEDKTQTLGKMSLGNDRWGQNKGPLLSVLSPRVASELLRDLTALAASAKS